MRKLNFLKNRPLKPLTSGLSGLCEDVNVGGRKDSLPAADPALVPVLVDAAGQGDQLTWVKEQDLNQVPTSRVATL